MHFVGPERDWRARIPFRLTDEERSKAITFGRLRARKALAAEEMSRACRCMPLFCVLLPYGSFGSLSIARANIVSASAFSARRRQMDDPRLPTTTKPCVLKWRYRARCRFPVWRQWHRHSPLWYSAALCRFAAMAPCSGTIDREDNRRRLMPRSIFFRSAFTICWLQLEGNSAFYANVSRRRRFKIKAF